MGVRPIHRVAGAQEPAVEILGFATHFQTLSHRAAAGARVSA
jgi:hypothetical protein